jgi:DNA-directed RNA polymerase subunit RPC12/RpoP
MRSASIVASLPARSRIQDRHACARCRQAILVSYEAEPDEEKAQAPVACPHCWAVNHVEIGGWAAAGADYVAEKA